MQDLNLESDFRYSFIAIFCIFFYKIKMLILSQQSLIFILTRVWQNMKEKSFVLFYLHLLFLLCIRYVALGKMLRMLNTVAQHKSPWIWEAGIKSSRPTQPAGLSGWASTYEIVGHSSVPRQGTYPGCKFHPQCGGGQKAANQWFLSWIFPFLSRAPFFSEIKKKIIFKETKNIPL